MRYFVIVRKVFVILEIININEYRGVYEIVTFISPGKKGLPIRGIISYSKPEESDYNKTEQGKKARKYRSWITAHLIVKMSEKVVSRWNFAMCYCCVG